MTGNGGADNPESAPFDPGVGGTPFAFAGSKVGQNLGLYIQDTISPIDDLHVSVGVRFDRYHLLIEDSAISPRLGVAYHVHGTGTVVRGSYSRIFMPPFSENLLLSSSPEARALSPNGDPGEDVQPERQNAYEVGAQQALGTHAKIDVAYYRKDVRNLADVDQFLDTTVTFPLSVAKGLAQGIEGRLDVPVYRGINGYLSVSRAKILLTAPLTGGLFLGEVPEAGERFYADHDQRWQSQFGVSYEHPSRRVFASVSGRYDTGIPFELPADFNPATFEDPQALTLVNTETGRARPRAIADVMVGSELYRHGNTRLELQGGVINMFNTTYLLNFSVDLQRHPLRRAADVHGEAEGFVLAETEPKPALVRIPNGPTTSGKSLSRVSGTHAFLFLDAFGGRGAAAASGICAAAVSGNRSRISAISCSSSAIRAMAPRRAKSLMSIGIHP